MGRWDLLDRVWSHVGIDGVRIETARDQWAALTDSGTTVYRPRAEFGKVDSSNYVFCSVETMWMQRCHLVLARIAQKLPVQIEDFDDMPDNLLQLGKCHVSHNHQNLVGSSAICFAHMFELAGRPDRALTFTAQLIDMPLDAGGAPFAGWPLASARCIRGRIHSVRGQTAAATVEFRAALEVLKNRGLWTMEAFVCKQWLSRCQPTGGEEVAVREQLAAALAKIKIPESAVETLRL